MPSFYSPYWAILHCLHQLILAFKGYSCSYRIIGREALRGSESLLCSQLSQATLLLSEKDQPQVYGTSNIKEGVECWRVVSIEKEYSQQLSVYIVPILS